MKLISYEVNKMKAANIYHFKKNNNTFYVLGIGKFDGFHIGHQKIVEQIIDQAKTNHCIPAIFTIKNYPSITVLNTWQERLAALKKGGIELCLWADFTEIQKLSHEEFLRKLQILCDIKAIVVGNNFRFGFHRKGDIDFLRLWGEKNEITVCAMESIKVNGKIVSSSTIKKLIENSKFFEARSMLGRWYSIKGKCFPGRGVGRNIGFPTINLKITNDNSPFTEGIYACLVKHGNRFYKSVVFYGKRLTFNDSISFEVHIPDNLIPSSYGKNFVVIPLAKIREPRKFTNVALLTAEIKKDVLKMKNIFSSIKLDDIREKL